MSKDRSGTFYELQKLIEDIAKVTKHTEKTAVIKKFLSSFEGDIYHLFHLLLCRDDKRVYNVREKVLVKVLSKILDVSEKEMITDLEQGDIGATMQKSKTMPPQSKSTFTLKEVDEWLDSLTQATKEEQQIEIFTKFVKRATADDMKYVTKIIDHDLKVHIGPRYALVALHPDAYNQYKITSDLKMIIKKVVAQKSKQQDEGKPALARKLSLSIDLMTPVLPMLARPSKSLEDTWNRCPNGMIAEIKYDGERIQIHKNGDTYQTFSRSLKPVTPHKVADVKDYIPKGLFKLRDSWVMINNVAFKNADTMILDGEILLMDSDTKQPLPFGTLGIHKKKAFSDATVCLYIFDILYLNGETLLETPMKQRRKILKEHIEEIPGHVQLTTKYKPQDVKQLEDLFHMCVSKNLEGLVVKDLKGVYQPNARHWIKIKKEHFQGMGDSADLLVLGMYYGTGSKGGKMSIFLMGVYDEDEDNFKTVCKVGNGFTDKEIDRLQTAFDVVKIEKDPSRCPSWLRCSKPLLPDFVVKNPKESPVWEIGGAEFSYSQIHTANAISIRFPRVNRYRDDKDWTTATNLKEIQAMYDLGGINRVVSKDKAAWDGDDDAVDQKDVKETKDVKPVKSEIGKSSAATDEPKKTKNVNAITNYTVNTSKASNTTKTNNTNNNNTNTNTNTKTNLQKNTQSSGSLQVVKHDIASLADNPRSERWMIIHCVDTSGTWTKKGAFGHISSKWKEAEKVYCKQVQNNVPGDVIIANLPDGNLICLLIVQKKHGGGGIPPLNIESFRKALKQAEKIALENSVGSVHFPVFHPDTPTTDGTKMTWPEVEELLFSSFSSERSIFIYDPWNSWKIESKKRPLETYEEQSEEEKQLQPALKKAKHFSAIFSDCTILVYGVFDEDHMRKEITNRGGRVFLEDDEIAVEDLTHLVTDRPWEEVFTAVLQENPKCKIVTPDWVRECVRSNGWCSPQPFFVPKK